MLNFKPVSIEDKEVINNFFFESTYRNCDFSFSNIFCWRHKYNTSFLIQDNFLFFHFYAGGKKSGYMMPLGKGDLKIALNILEKDAKDRNDDFRLFAVSKEMFNQIENIYPKKFEFCPNRNWFEYIYESESLIHLKGKKLQSKRNHINKFKRTYSYEYLPITRDLIPGCLELYCRWCRENGGCMEDQSLIDERYATQQAFDNFEKLGLKGGAIQVDGKIVAYSYGQQLTNDTFVVHAEKSLYDIDGGFSIINQQFAEHEAASYRYINREEDIGLESLRQAKLSYQPVFLLEKGAVKKLIEHDTICI